MSEFRDAFQTSSTNSDHSESPLASRRKVIGTLGLAVSALYATSTSANAGWFGRSKEDEIPVVKVKTSSTSRSNNSKAPSGNIGGFPDEWARMQGSNIQSYANYINSLKLKKISAQDVIKAHAKQRGSSWNTLPPKKWWPRMGYTLRVVDRISEIMDVPVKEIVSAYRSPSYNARCAGAKKHSWHQANVAVDVKFETSSYHVTRTARAVRDRGLFKGGVGSYSSFTHIDTRGENVNW